MHEHDRVKTALNYTPIKPIYVVMARNVIKDGDNFTFSSR
jgi:hypothetical protein